MTKLERLAHMTFVALCLVGITLMLEARFAAKVETSAASPRARSVAEDVEGKPMKLPGVPFRQARVSVVLQLSPTCPYCKASMGFYRRLSERHSKSVVPIIVAFSGSLKPMRDQLAENGVAVQTLVNVESLFGLYATPSLYLVDSAGTVTKRYVGLLDATTEEQVLSLIEQSPL
jgi:hypothetical protein